MFRSFADSFYPIFSLDQKQVKGKECDLLLLLMALFITAVASFVFRYEDMADIVCNSNLLLKSVLEGKFSEFYTYTLENSTSVYAANYDFPLYLIVAIWNLPFALLFHFEINGFVYLWFKLLVVLCVVACSCIMYKNYRLFDDEGHLTKGTFLLLMLTSPFVFLGEFIAGQYDCISMVLILAGLYKYLKGEDRFSLILFCLALPLKTFAIFLFIPLLVYKEKNPFKILIKTACLFVIPFLCRMFFKGDPAYLLLLGAQGRDAAKLLLDASIKISNIEVHVFLLLYLLLCYICYFCKYDKSKVLLISATVYASFIMFVPIRSYWVFLAEPFLIMLITTRPKLYKVNSLIHSAAVVCGSVFFLYSHWIYNSTWMTRGLGLIQIFNLPSVVKYGSFANFFNVHGWGTYMPLLRTVFIGSYILLLVINFFDPEKINFSTEISPRVLSWIKGIVIVGMVSIMIFVETYPCNLPAIDTLNYVVTKVRPYVNYNSSARTEENSEKVVPKNQVEIMSFFGENSTSSSAIDAEDTGNSSGKYYSADINSGAVIEQPFSISSKRTVSEVYFQCYNTQPSRGNRMRLVISIVNTDTKQVMAGTVVGAALITTGEINVVKIPTINLSEGDYFIRIASAELQQDKSFYKGPIYMMCNPDDQETAPAIINGEKMDHPVCVCLN